MRGVFEDLTGKVYGVLTVVRRANTSGTSIWTVRCVCGTERNVLVSSLKSGAYKNCYCKSKTGVCHLPEGEGAFNELYARYRRAAKIRKLSFELTPTQFRDKVASPCHYCGRQVNQLAVTGKKVNNYLGNFKYTGIDRVNNKLGYILGNCLPCCKICNYAKHNLSYGDFMRYIKDLVQYQMSKEER